MQHNRAGPVMGTGEPVPEDMRAGELALPLVCHAVAWVRERCFYLALVLCELALRA